MAVFNRSVSSLSLAGGFCSADIASIDLAIITAH
jgi:hypothetical protein